MKTYIAKKIFQIFYLGSWTRLVILAFVLNYYVTISFLLVGIFFLRNFFFLTSYALKHVCLEADCDKALTWVLVLHPGVYFRHPPSNEVSLALLLPGPFFFYSFRGSLGIGGKRKQFAFLGIRLGMLFSLCSPSLLYY